MKRMMLLTVILAIGLCGSVFAQQTGEDFLGAPVIEGKVISKTEGRLEIRTPLSHDEALAFYKKQLEGMEDIRYRNWPDQSYIEDDSNRPWHSVTIDKESENGTKVVIMKDNWTWIIGTLILRYVAVFVVLLVLLVGMTVSSKIITKAEKK